MAPQKTTLRGPEKSRERGEGEGVPRKAEGCRNDAGDAGKDDDDDDDDAGRRGAERRRKGDRRGILESQRGWGRRRRSPRDAGKTPRMPEKTP